MAGGLNEEEFTAIRGAIGQALGTPRTHASDEVNVRAVALIADDVAAESARPDALRIANRWIPEARLRLQRTLGLKLELHVEGAELISGSVLKEELAMSWTRCFEVSGRPGSLLVAMSGPMIPRITAQLLGGGESENEEESEAPPRSPSLATLGVFSKAGDAMGAALVSAWKEDQNVLVTGLPDDARSDERRRAFLASELLIAVNIGVEGRMSGRIRVFGAPRVWTAPPPPPKVTKLVPAAIDQSLANVPVEVRVELGHARMSMSDWAAVRPGTLIPLLEPVDELLTVSFGGIPTVLGRPVIAKGALAVEIVRPITGDRRSRG